MTLESMMIPIDTYLQARVGHQGRDGEIEIKAAGEAGIPMLEWRFWPDFYWDDRVGYEKPGRGAAGFRGFDFERIKNAPPFPEIGEVSESECGRDSCISRSRSSPLPRRQTCGFPCIRTTPPVPLMRGVARIFHSPDGMRRFLAEVPSPNSGITFCQGTFTEMGIDVLKEIRYFGGLKKINLVHFRGVRGRVPQYTEVFIDEGDVDMLQAMETFREVGYAGPIVSDHTPKVEGNTPWGIIGRTFSHGYMRAIVHAANA
jgi:mannonate dehydratase